jgi:thiamine biosynthesis lipoprotein
MKSRCDEVKRARPLLGTIVEIAASSDKTRRSEETIDRAFAAISVVQQRMSFHDPDSTLSRVNAKALAGPVRVDEKTFRVLKMASDLYRLSGGLFDPTITRYLERSGFLPQSFGTLAGQSVSFANVQLLSGKRVRFQQPGVRLDLGGLAKGFAVDEAVAVMRAAGIESGLVNAGGDLRAFGPRSFAIEIRNPRHPESTLGPLLIRDRAVATSAHYFADRIRPGARIGPFVHPHLGQFRGDLLSVTVTASTAMVADALTKIVMLDPANSLPVLEQFAAAALVFDPSGSILCTRDWHETIQTAA